ncbi:MAG: ATP-binding protein [Clostridia bacterium]|nr:ATP-binding protein [Clostridia bacterium]
MNNERINFTLGYETLKLLGKGLYSNVWAALSELIANGIDAHSSQVDVLIDMKDKAHSVIEILDNGDGMNKSDIQEKYVVIGNNKREGAPDSDILMGRKGVGKLAALYLSKHYEFITKKLNEYPTAWSFDFNDNTSSVPGLNKIEIPNMQMLDQFRLSKSGTLLRLNDVNLSNMAEEAINALSLIMSNYFLYENLPDVKVNFYVIDQNNEVFEYDKPITMKKKVGFNNMIALYGEKELFDKLGKGSYKYDLDYNASFEVKELVKNREDINFNTIPLTSGEYETVVNGESIKIPYFLNGWIGIHSTILPSEAKNNDDNFVKNKFYNPNRLRLYIRNKLAVDDFLSYLKNTQQGINYIEGEISFDLLDTDLLDDITTSNRQDVDVHDERVSLLVEITKKIVNSLIEKRNAVSKEVNELNKTRKETIESEAKRKAKSAIRTDLSSVGVTPKEINNILNIVTNKFKGDINLKAKEIYKVFLSHARRDKRFSDFIYYFLLKKGAKKEDIFYTTNYVGGETNLTKAIKDNIIENNVLVLFLDTVNFNKSQYCLFEGGAFWATRSIEDCIHVHTSTDWIPDYINDRQKYHVPLNATKKIHQTAFELTPKKYNELCDIFNIVINHLNKSSLHLEDKILNISKVDFPSEMDMENSSIEATSLMDGDFVSLWNFYVVEGNSDKDEEGNIISKDVYIERYNQLVEKML